MIAIKIPDAVIEQVVKGIMENFPEASNGCALVCTRWKYDEWFFRFEDFEAGGKEYELRKPQLIAAFALMASDKWPKGCTQLPLSTDPEVLDNWLCQADAIDFDAFAQLACLGEVIYS